MDGSNRHRLRVEFQGGSVSAVEFDGFQIEPTVPLDRMMNCQEKAVRDLVWAIRQLAEMSLEPDQRTIHVASARYAGQAGKSFEPICGLGWVGCEAAGTHSHKEG